MAEKIDDLRLKAAELLARGASEHEVASICGRSRSWVQNLKRSENFRQLVQDVKKSVSEELVEKAKSVASDEFEAWADRRSALREREWQIAQALLSKAEEILAFSLEERKWSFREAAVFLQIGSEIGRRSSELWEGDLNAAIALVKNFGFRIVDEYNNENDDE